MVVGNLLSASVTAARQIVSELSGNRLELEARLALGQPWKVAARPSARPAARNALPAQIEPTQPAGLLALTGALPGLILPGVEPVVAVPGLGGVMYLPLGGAATDHAHNR